jgi:hypothetical protein
VALRERAGAAAVIVNACMSVAALGWHLRARARVAALESRQRELESREVEHA